MRVRLEVYKNQFAIAVCPGDIESPTVGGADRKRALFDISGINASFVLTVYQEKIYMSARSIDEVTCRLLPKARRLEVILILRSAV